jgi:2-dehydro-3-deoxygalactonokinase
MLNLRNDEDSAAFTSGLIIGSDVAARVSGASEAPVYILADPNLAALYSAAVEARGGTAIVVDGEAAFLAGIIAIGKHLS